MNPTIRFSKRLKFLPMIAGFIVLPCLILGVFVWLTEVDEESYQTYHDLMVNAGVKKEDLKATPYIIKQKRFNVQKDILFMEDEKRMQLKLNANEAELVFDHHDDQTDMVEQMRGVTCEMQEELFYQLPNGQRATDDPSQKNLKPMQTVRSMKASHGTYTYESDRFRANNVEIEKFTTPGHTLNSPLFDKKKLMSGLADLAEFSLDGKRIQFQANQLKATLHTPLRDVQTK